MNRIALAIAAAAISALAQQASAADMARQAPPPLMRAPSAILASNWAGIYVGGHAGYSWLTGEYRLNDGLIERFEIDRSGFLGGGQLGVQAQWGHWVFGIEGTYAWADLEQTSTSALVPAKTAAVDVRQIGTIAGKLGWAADRWMVYGKAGIAYGRFHTLERNATPAALTFDSRLWETGYTAGIGVDYMWLPNWIVGLELDYYGFRFNRQMMTGAVRAAITDSNADIYAIMVRANYLFNMRW
jgi:outer membrane immunogenic protein